MRSLPLAIPLAATLLLIGCATTMHTGDVERSGFLGDYSMMRPGTGDEAQLVWVDTDTDFSRFEAVIIDPVVIQPSPSAAFDVPAEDSERLARTLHEALAAALSEDYTLTDQPGPSTMRLRTAITEAERSHRVADLASTILLPARLLSLGKRLATGTHAFVGRAAVEAELVDSVSGDRLLAAVDERAGSKVLRGSLRAWDDVEDAYAFWANRLSERLMELRNR